MKVFKALFFTLIAMIVFGSGYLLRQVQEGRPAVVRDGAGKVVSFDGQKHDYHCPMHPHIHSDKPGKCPICNMALVETKADGPGTTPAGIQIDASQQQLIGVKTGFAAVTNKARQLQAQGKVTYDETAITHVHTRVEGWIEDVYVDFTGKWVERGQPLLTIYSPEMLASQRELLLAAKAKQILSGQQDSTARMFEAAKSRLRFWEMSDAQIEEVLRTGEPIRFFTLYAHHSGYVTDRKAFPHQKATPDMELYTIVDLNRVWIMADIFESDVAQIRPGQSAKVSVAYLPGKTLAARVNFVQPTVDPVTRTIKVRLEAANPGLQLKPEMFAAVDFQVPSTSALTVPAEAVLDSGVRKVVYVVDDGGRFAAREVQTGERRDGQVVILSGLSANEKIATSGVFLLDSESQLKRATKQ